MLSISVLQNANSFKASVLLITQILLGKEIGEAIESQLEFNVWRIRKKHFVHWNIYSYMGKKT